MATTPAPATFTSTPAIAAPVQPPQVVLREIRRAGRLDVGDAAAVRVGKRFAERAEKPYKRWKLQQSDLDDRRLWDAYMDAYEQAVTETSTEWAPWHVIPADRKWVRNAAVMRLLVDAVREMKPEFPEPSALPVGST